MISCIMASFSIFSIFLKPFRYLLSKRKFKLLLSRNGLQLDVRGNLSELETLIEVFIKREYANYFPFYEEATVVDIGAHKAYFSIFAARNTASSSTIIAVEPDPDNQHWLQLNLKANNCQMVKIEAAALNAKDEPVALYSGNSVNHSIVGGEPSETRHSKRQVKGITIMSLMEKYNLQHIDFLKMDCEGAEYIMLDWPADVFQKIKVISLEFHDLKNKAFTSKALECKLVSMGFEILVHKYLPTNYNLNYGRLIARRK